MKTVTVRELKAGLSKYLKASENEDILITSHGKPKAVIHASVTSLVQSSSIVPALSSRK